jgi:ATPase subunit of ABC transporter with duplicated ATPase domains
VIDEVATRIWHFEGGHIDDFKGPYEEFMVYAQQKAAEKQKVAAGRGKK